MIDGIKARAIRRAGELLKTFQDPTGGLRQGDADPRAEGAHPTGPRSQREAAEAAGMSPTPLP